LSEVQIHETPKLYENINAFFLVLKRKQLFSTTMGLYILKRLNVTLSFSNPLIPAISMNKI
jgi:hypothetical protein